jgi:hypothetical protein
VLLGTTELRFTVTVSDVRGYVEAIAALCQ